MRRYRRSFEPLWWLPFSGGMMLDALLMPALIIITGVLVPMGMIMPEDLRLMLLNPWVQAVLFVLIALTFFHAAHRTRFVLADLGLKAPKLLAFLCYGAAILGTLYAAAVVLQFL